MAHASSLASVSSDKILQDKHVLEARRKFSQSLEDEVLDYKHNHPVNVENCVVMLRKIFNNVLENLQEPKYRQVKATSNAFKNVTAQRGGEHLMLLAGWHPKVVEMVKYWIWDGEEGSTKQRVLQEVVAVLDKAMHTIHEKAERKRREGEERKQKMEAERERIRLNIEEDKADRKLRQELSAVPATTTTSPRASSGGQASPSGRASADGHVLYPASAPRVGHRDTLGHGEGADGPQGGVHPLVAASERGAGGGDGHGE